VYAWCVHRASIPVYIRVDLADVRSVLVDSGAHLRLILLASGDETGKRHHLLTKSLILRAKAHDLSHLQIISALPAVDVSNGQMQAVSAKSGAVQPH
jgi:hypothetical protein